MGDLLYIEADPGRLAGCCGLSSIGDAITRAGEPHRLPSGPSSELRQQYLDNRPLHLATVYGKVVVVPPAYTTQECSRCGTLVKKTLSARTHVCPKCGLVLGRDHNARLTILSRGLALLGDKLPQGMREVTLGER